MAAPRKLNSYKANLNRSRKRPVIILAELSRTQLVELGRTWLAELGRTQLAELGRTQLAELSRT